MSFSTLANPTFDAAASSPAMQAVADDLLGDATDIDISDGESTQANAGSSASILAYSVSRLEQPGKGKGVLRDLVSEGAITRNYLKSLVPVPGRSTPLKSFVPVPGPSVSSAPPPKPVAPYASSGSAPGPSASLVPGRLNQSSTSKGKFKAQIGAARSETMRGLRPAMRGRVPSAKPVRRSTRLVSNASGDAPVRHLILFSCSIIE
jgi:hypothetical protein